MFGAKDHQVSIEHGPKIGMKDVWYEQVEVTYHDGGYARGSKPIGGVRRVDSDEPPLRVPNDERGRTYSIHEFNRPERTFSYRVPSKGEYSTLDLVAKTSPWNRVVRRSLRNMDLRNDNTSEYHYSVGQESGFLDYGKDSGFVMVKQDGILIPVYRDWGMPVKARDAIKVDSEFFDEVLGGATTLQASELEQLVRDHLVNV